MPNFFLQFTFSCDSLVCDPAHSVFFSLFNVVPKTVLFFAMIFGLYWRIWRNVVSTLYSRLSFETSLSVARNGFWQFCLFFFNSYFASSSTRVCEWWWSRLRSFWYIIIGFEFACFMPSLFLCWILNTHRNITNIMCVEGILPEFIIGTKVGGFWDHFSRNYLNRMTISWNKFTKFKAEQLFIFAKTTT